MGVHIGDNKAVITTEPKAIHFDLPKNIDKNLSHLLNTDASNPFKYLLINTKFSRAVLSKDLRTLASLNNGPVWEFLL